MKTLICLSKPLLRERWDAILFQNWMLTVGWYRSNCLRVSCVKHYKLHKPLPRFAPCRLDFDSPLSSITTLPQSPLPSRPHSWLPSTNPPYFTLASVHFLSSPLFLPSFRASTFLPPLSPLLLCMPIARC